MNAWKMDIFCATHRIHRKNLDPVDVQCMGDYARVRGRAIRYHIGANGVWRYRTGRVVVGAIEDLRPDAPERRVALLMEAQP